MNPDFEGLLADVVTYATSTYNLSLRKEANQRWHQNQGISTGFLTFGYNLLQSVDKRAILLTQHDNDTYPVWMLQDAQDIRTDVLVINIDFLLFDGYRKPIFKQLGITPFVLEHVDINDYEVNWEAVVKHFLTHYKGDRPLHISRTVSPKWYEGYEAHMHSSGLSWLYNPHKSEPSLNEIDLIEHMLLWDQLAQPLTFESNAARLDDMNSAYLPMLASAYEQYMQNGHQAQAKWVQHLATLLMDKIPSHPSVTLYQHRFK